MDLQFDDKWENHGYGSYEMEPHPESHQVDRIKRAMEELPEGCRIIFQLHIFEEMEHSEIADKLGIKEGSSRAQYVRAKTKIKEMIRNNG